MKNTMKEFKEFLMRGNIMDMAVGVVMGTAFGNIVTSLVDNIIMPLVGVLISGIDFTDLVWQVGEAKVAYGTFIQNIINFIIIGFCIFFVVKLMSKFQKKKEPEPEPEPEVSDEVKLLTEIKDLLAAQNKTASSK